MRPRAERLRMKARGLSWCVDCAAYKPMDDFSWTVKREGRRQSYCKKCAINRMKAWKKKYPDRSRLTELRQKARYRYGIELSEIRAIAKSQDSRCAICNKKGKLDTDHDHEDKKIRGMLCRNCNLALGMFKDDRKQLDKASEYLAARECTVYSLS